MCQNIWSKRSENKSRYIFKYHQDNLVSYWCGAEYLVFVSSKKQIFRTCTILLSHDRKMKFWPSASAVFKLKMSFSFFSYIFHELKLFFANFRPSASNFKKKEQLLLTVVHNNFGNKIPFLLLSILLAFFFSRNSIKIPYQMKTGSHHFLAY